MRRHAATTGEVRALCGDLQVLGRTEFKALLRWRLALRKALAAELGELPAEPGHKKKKKADGEQKPQQAGEEEEEGGEEVDGEEKLLAEMKALKEAADKREKKDKKKQRESKRKARIRCAHRMSRRQALPGGVTQVESLGVATRT